MSPLVIVISVFRLLFVISVIIKERRGRAHGNYDFLLPPREGWPQYSLRKERASFNCVLEERAPSLTLSFIFRHEWPREAQEEEREETVQERLSPVAPFSLKVRHSTNAERVSPTNGHLASLARAYVFYLTHHFRFRCHSRYLSFSLSFAFARVSSSLPHSHSSFTHPLVLSRNNLTHTLAHSFSLPFCNHRLPRGFHVYSCTFTLGYYVRQYILHFISVSSYARR